MELQFANKQPLQLQIVLQVLCLIYCYFYLSVSSFYLYFSFAIAPFCEFITNIIIKHSVIVNLISFLNIINKLKTTDSNYAVR